MGAATGTNQRQGKEHPWPARRSAVDPRRSV